MAVTRSLRTLAVAVACVGLLAAGGCSSSKASTASFCSGVPGLVDLTRDMSQSKTVDQARALIAQVDQTVHSAIPKAPEEIKADVTIASNELHAVSTRIQQLESIPAMQTDPEVLAHYKALAPPMNRLLAWIKTHCPGAIPSSGVTTPATNGQFHPLSSTTTTP